MTGYGQWAAENDSFRVAVSVRSVNHRFLDLVIRLGDECRDLESKIRQVADQRLSRGRVEMRVAVEDLSGGEAKASIDEHLVAELMAAANRLETGNLRNDPLSIGQILHLPEVVRIRRDRAEFEAEDRELVLEVATRALDELVEMRQVEGTQLAGFLGERLTALGTVVEQLEGERDEVRRRLLQNLRARVEELLDSQEISADRMAQETALLAEKIDVQEELDRLSAHLENFGKAMLDQGPIGRRLDFLAQEIHRELNTLGSKCRDARMAEWVVDSKVTCEQLREQVQNVE